MDRAAAAVSLCGVTTEFHARGWCLGTSGNFSVKLQDDPVQMLITRSGCDKRRLSPEDMVVVGLDGKAVESETLEPSAEALLHTTIAAVTNARAVLHVHSVWNTLLSEHYCESGGFVITGYEMLKRWQVLESGDLLWLSISFIVSYLVAWGAIRWFLGFVSSHSFRVFAWYRILFGGFVLFLVLADLL